MRTKTINLYTYGELSPEAQEKARDWYRQSSAGDDFWSECALEDIAEVGGLLGITFDTPRGRQSGKAIWFSGFASQGDGCSYDGTWRASDCNADKVIDEFTGDSPSNVELRRIASALAVIAKDYPESLGSVSSSWRTLAWNFTLLDEVARTRLSSLIATPWLAAKRRQTRAPVSAWRVTSTARS